MLSPIEELLRRPGLLSEEGRALLRVADRNALRLLRLVNALLDFSRIEAGRMTARYEATDIAALTADLASNFRSAIEGAGLKFIVDCAPLTAPAFIDRDMWEKIVLNLLSNAFKYTFTGHVAVRLRPVGDSRVELAIEDTGAGIPKAELPRLFERFHRVEGARGRSHEGTGIGLALVQELARLHGGEVKVRSVEGAGSTFLVTIPTGAAQLSSGAIAAENGTQEKSNRARAFVQDMLHWDLGPLPVAAPGSALFAETEAGRGRRVIVADDNADMRAYIQRLLQAQGYEVEVAVDGQAALAAAIRQQPDLILSDVMMPGMDGFALIRELRELRQTRETPVILVSARAGEEAKIEGLEAGADDYVVKPFSARELYARVASAIQLAELRRETSKAIRDESLRVRSLFEQAPGFITILTGPNHVFEFANISYRRLVGERALTGKPVREALPEVEGQGYFELLDKVYATGERYVGREAALRLQSLQEEQPHVVMIDFIYEPIRDPNGTVTGIFVEGYEVTDRVAAQAALRASEEQLRLATEAAEIGLWDVDNTSNRLYWPPRVKAMFGISPGSPVSMDDFYQGLHPDDRDAASAAYQAANDPERRALYDVEYRTIGKEDGLIRWVAAKGRGVFNDQGQCVRDRNGDRYHRAKSQGSAAERAERNSGTPHVGDLGGKEAARRHRRRHRRLRPSRGPRLQLVGDQQDIVGRVRPHLRRASARGRRQHAGHAGGAARASGCRQESLGAGAGGRRVRRGRAFGEPLLRRHYEMRFRTLRDRDGRLVGAYQFVSDVTERLQEQNRLKEAEAALAQAQKMEAVGQLTGGIAHDFNNLLGAVVGSFDLIRRKPADIERVRRYAEAGLQAAERGAKLTAQLLAFSQGAAHRDQARHRIGPGGRHARSSRSDAWSHDPVER